MDSTNSPDKPRNMFDPSRHGLWPRFVTKDDESPTGARVDTRAWNSAVEDGRYVGDCRFCGAHMRPQPTETHNRVVWYTATCVNCGKEIAAPNGDLARFGKKRAYR